MKRPKPLPPLEILRGLLHYDPMSGAFTWKVSHSRVPAGSPAGTVTPKGYLLIVIARNGYKAHRIAYYMGTGVDPSTSQIDHKDNNPLNNRIANLRLAEAWQNQANTGIQKNNSTGYKGVYYDAARRNFRTEICCQGRRFTFGTFATAEDAAIAVKTARERLHGEFANHGEVTR